MGHTALYLPYCRANLPKSLAAVLIVLCRFAVSAGGCAVADAAALGRHSDGGKASAAGVAELFFARKGAFPQSRQWRQNGFGTHCFCAPSIQIPVRQVCKYKGCCRWGLFLSTPISVYCRAYPEKQNLPKSLAAVLRSNSVLFAKTDAEGCRGTRYAKPGRSQTRRAAISYPKILE